MSTSACSKGLVDTYVSNTMEAITLHRQTVYLCSSYSNKMSLFEAYHPLQLASLITQLVKNSPAVEETLVQFLGQEGLLEKGQATHSSILGLPLWLSW